MRRVSFVLLALFSTPVSAADWRLVFEGGETELGRSMAFVDASSIQRADNRVEMWIELRIERPPVRADGARTRIIGHCRERWFEVLEGFYLKGVDQVGPHPVERRQSAEPGTNMYFVLENVCAGRFLSGVVDPVQYVAQAWRQR